MTDPHAFATLPARRPLLLVIVGMFLFSTAPLLISGADLPGPVLSFWRLWIGVVLLGGLTAVHVRRTGRRPTRRDWRRAAACGTAFGAHQVMFMAAITETSVVDVTLMQVLQPIAVGALAVPLFGERPGVRFRIWSVVAIVGASIVVLAGSSRPGGSAIGMALAAMNVVLYALYFVGAKRTRETMDVVPFLFGVVVSAACAVTAYCVLTRADLGAIDGRGLAIAAAIALVPGLLGHFLSTWPLPWIAANIPPLVQLAIPFVSGTAAWLILGEQVTAAQFAGGVVTIGGAAGAITSSAGRSLMARADAAEPRSPKAARRAAEGAMDSDGAVVVASD